MRQINDATLMSLRNLEYSRVVYYDEWNSELLSVRTINNADAMRRILSRYAGASFIVCSNKSWDWRQNEKWKSILALCVAGELHHEGYEYMVVQNEPSIAAGSSSYTFNGEPKQFKLVKENLNGESIYVLYLIKDTTAIYQAHIIPVFNLASEPKVIEVEEYLFKHLQKHVDRFVAETEDKYNKIVEMYAKDTSTLSNANTLVQGMSTALLIAHSFKRKFEDKNVLFTPDHDNIVSNLLKWNESATKVGEKNNKVDKYITPTLFVKANPYIGELGDILKNIKETITIKQGEVHVKVA